MSSGEFDPLEDDLMGYIISQCPLLGSPDRQNTPSNTPFVAQPRTSGARGGARSRRGRNPSGNDQSHGLNTTPKKGSKSRRSLASPRKDQFDGSGQSESKRENQRPGPKKSNFTLASFLPETTSTSDKSKSSMKKSDNSRQRSNNVSFATNILNNSRPTGNASALKASKALKFSEDEFPSLGSSADKTDSKPSPKWASIPFKSASNRKKRITLTPLAQNLVLPPNKITESFPKQESFSSPTKILEKERELLKAKRLEESSPRILPDTSVVSLKSPVSSKADVSRITSVAETPERGKTSNVHISDVTRKQELLELSENFVKRLSEPKTAFGSFHCEIEFLFGLLVLNPTETKPGAPQNLLLSSVANCVFFAAKTLHRLFNPVIRFFGSELAVTLSENRRFVEFSGLSSAEIQEKLSSGELECSQDSVSGQKYEFFPSKELTKNHFPNQTSFHTFKVQRDEFTQIYSDWCRDAKRSEIDFSSNFGARVDKLVKIGSHTLNYSLLAELFASKLLETIGDNEAETSDSNTDLSDIPDQLSRLGLKDPDRVKRLESRMDVEKSTKTNRSQFHGKEIFFKDFILHASNATFTQFLKDYMLAKLLHLHKTTGADIKVFQKMEKLEFFLESLTTLGKFLGYLWFLPYQQLKSLTNELQEPLIRARTQHDSLPRIVMERLEKSPEIDHLVILLPWISEFLYFADSLVLEIDGYKDLILQLHQMLKVVVTHQFHTPTNIGFYLSSKLSMLLNQPQLVRIKLLVEEKLKFTLPSFTGPLGDLNINRRFVAEEIAWIDKVKDMLKTAHISLSPHNPTRKINPMKLDPSPIVPMGIFSPESPMKNANLEVIVNLEKQLFAQQPAIVRRIVELGADCLADCKISSLKKFMRSKAVERREEICCPSMEAPGRFVLPSPSSDVCYRILQQAYIEELPEPKNGLYDSISIMLESQEISEGVRKACDAVMKRLSDEKAQSWMRRGQAREWISKEIRLIGKGTSLLTDEGKNQEINSDPQLFIAPLIQKMRESLLKLELGGETCVSSDVKQLIEKCEATLGNLEAYPNSVKAVLEHLLDRLKQLSSATRANSTMEI